MIGVLQLHLGPLYYLVVPVGVAVVLIVALALRHRRPKSLEANVESFSRGLRALSPGAEPRRRGRRPSPPALAPARPPARTANPTPRGVAATPGTPIPPITTTRRPAGGSSPSGADAG